MELGPPASNVLETIGGRADDGRTTCQNTPVFIHGPLLDHMEKYLSSFPLSAGFIMKWECRERSRANQMGEKFGSPPNFISEISNYEV